MLEFTQKLNRPIAMYMAENVEWVKEGRLDPKALESLAPHIMMINPSVEVYLLDASGRVVAPVLDDNNDVNNEETTLARATSTVDLVPVQRYLNEEIAYPIRGNNPAKPGENGIFSVWPIHERNRIEQSRLERNNPLGYIYVLLANENHQTLFSSIKSSYSIRDLFITLAGVTALTLCGGVFIFFKLTRRLRKLAASVRIAPAALLPKQQSIEERVVPMLASASNVPNTDGDEIDLLRRAYENMTSELVEQYQRLEQSDASRREFVASLSHDLRTPLTSLQNYQETVLAKWTSMDEAGRYAFVTGAHKQTMRLKHLISQLFEISKLNSPDLKLQCEKFSMLELAFDCAQDFAITSRKKGVSIKVSAKRNDLRVYDVIADIELIQRVLENLLTNAVRHTPKHGVVRIVLRAQRDQNLRVQIEDTGCGLSGNQINTFKSTGMVDRSTSPSTKQQISSGLHGGAGFGLAIVRRILHLHGSRLQLANSAQISDNARKDQSTGTSFFFLLPTAAHS